MPMQPTSWLSGFRATQCSPFKNRESLSNCGKSFGISAFWCYSSAGSSLHVSSRWFWMWKSAISYLCDSYALWMSPSPYIKCVGTFSEWLYQNSSTLLTMPVSTKQVSTPAFVPKAMSVFGLSPIINTFDLSS
jgi:hypothetical protein